MENFTKLNGIVYKFYFEGKFDSDEKGFKFPEEDAYLQGIKDKFTVRFNDDYWKNIYYGYIEILFIGVCNPPSEGYPAFLKIIICTQDERNLSILINQLEQVEKEVLNANILDLSLCRI